jgi:hypothetical protein
MKKLILSVAFTIIAIIGLAQERYVSVFAVYDDSTAFGKSLARRTLVFDYYKHTLWTLDTNVNSAQYLAGVTNKTMVLGDTIDVDSLHAIYAEIDTLWADYAMIDTMTVDSFHSVYAEIDTLWVDYATIDTLTITYADIETLHADSLFVDSVEIALYTQLSNSDTLLTSSNDTVRYRLDYWDTTAVWIEPRTLLQINCDSSYMTDGVRMLYVNIAEDNTSLGEGALPSCTGDFNTALGMNALNTSSSGAYNTAVGARTMQLNQFGSYNTAVGYSAGYNAPGIGNIYLGYFSGYNVTDSLDGRLFINSVQQSSQVDDTTGSIIYGIMAATTPAQRLWLNANAYVREQFNLLDVPISTSDSILVISNDSVMYKLESTIVPDSAGVSAYADSAYVSYHADLADSATNSVFSDSAYVSYHADLADSATNAVFADSAAEASLVVNAVTFNAGGGGGASGSTFNGSAALTVSYNTIGSPSTTGTGASGTWSIDITGNAATASKIDSTHCYEYLSADTIKGCSPIVLDADKVVLEADTLVVGNLTILTYADSLSVGDSINLPSGIAAMIYFMIDSSTTLGYAQGWIKSDASVTLVGPSADIDDADTPGKFSVYDNGAFVTIKNNLVGIRKLRLRVEY